MVDLNKSKHLAGLLGLSLFASLFFVQRINLMASDLGRHLKNGELLIQTKKPITTNLYSYTYATYPFVNHHWGFGVLVYGIYQLTGFAGLTLFNTGIAFLAITLALNYSARRAGLKWSGIAFLIALPLLVYRTEIRPETISMLFVVLTVSIITSTRALRFKVLTLFLVQALWVNCHLFFVFGPLLSASYMLTQLLDKQYESARSTLVLLLIQILASLINPYGLQGTLYPLQIFNDYGYRIAENQTPFLLLRVIPSPIYKYLPAVCVVVLLTTVLTIRTAIKTDLVHTLLSLIFLAVSLKMVRLMPYFGVFALFSLAYGFYSLNLTYGTWVKRLAGKPILLIALGGLGAVLGFALASSALYNPFTNFGAGLMPGSNNSAEFFKTTKLNGPIFNNYDAGGYLIFNLYPNEKVFVDNRPEAYPSRFFTTEYVPMQEKELVWANLSKEYNINVIYFYRRDYTPWAQPFLISRLKDPMWAPVYVDDYALILVKRDPSNEAVIKKHELPKELFRY